MMSSSSSICEKIIIRTTFRDYTLGGKYEYSPFASTWCSFNPYRVERICNYKLVEDPRQAVDECHINAKTRIQSKHHAMHLRNATKIDKFNAFQSMFEFGEKKNHEQQQQQGHDSSKIIIDAPINTSIYESTSNTIIDQFGDYSKMRGDEAIWFKLMTHTRYSGIEQIDKNEFDYVERTIPDGITSIQLYALFEQYIQECHGKGTNTCIVKSCFIDPKVTGMFINEQRQTRKNAYKNDAELVEKAYEATFKALVHFEVTIEGFNYQNYSKSIFGYRNLNEKQIHAYLKSPVVKGDVYSGQLFEPFKANNTNHSPINNHNYKQAVLPSSTSFRPCLYNSKAAVDTMMNHLEQLVQVYCNSFVTIEDRASKFKPLNKNVSNLQLLILTSEQGQCPVIAYGTDHCPYTREYASEELRKEDLKLYGYNSDTEKYFKMMANSSLRRHGLSKEKFIQVIDNHYSITNKSTTVDPLFITCQKVVASLGTFAANSAYYTSDYRYIPIFDVKGSSYHKNHVERKMIDSFDNEILNLGSNADDCEGQSFTGTAIIDAFTYGRYDLDCNSSSSMKTKKKGKANKYNYKALRSTTELRFGEWKSTLLQRIQLILNNHKIPDVGSTVTSAYVNNDNETINIKDMDLPIINDQLDRNSKCDGHAFGFMFPNHTISTMLKNGRNDKSIVSSLKPFYLNANGSEVISPNTYHKRDTSLNTLVLEGTGDIESTVRPVNEVYKNNPVERRKAATQKLFLKSLKARLIELGHGEELTVNNDKTKKRDAIMNKFTAKSPPFYIEEQPLERRVSSFYREVVHGVFPTLYTRHDVTLSQAAFIKNGKYGVNMGDLLRASLSENANGIELISPYRNSRKEWLESTIPMMELIVNQMPIMAFGRYTKEQYESDVYSHYVDPTTLHLNEWRFPTSMKEIREMKTRVGGNESRFHKVHENPNEVIVGFYSRVWKLNQSREDMIQFQEFIESLPGLKHYGYFIEKHLPNCDPLVEILCIIDINEFEKH